MGEVRVLAESSLEARKKALRFLFEYVVDLMGYKFSPDEEDVDFLLTQEALIEAREGAPYCPCQGLRGVRELDMKIVCPCIPFHREHFDRMRRCWCGLFVHKDVQDVDALEIIAPPNMRET
ncbi:MAG: ferredoxin-thioredoxin reductase catalytic domain-containing protein [Thermodesulfobacteriota bacterium]